MIHGPGMDEREFVDLLKRYLSPARAIQSPEFLKGRDADLKAIRQAFYQPGRQVFICGHRGVGKSSLAQTSAFLVCDADHNPTFITCSKGSDFYSLIKEIVSMSVNEDPRVILEKSSRDFGLSKILSYNMKREFESGRVPKPESLNEAVILSKIASEYVGGNLVAVVDEFDQITEQKDKELFADFVKQVGDQGIGVKLIFCGIADSLDQLFSVHGSAYRYFHAVELGRLRFDPRLEIIENAASGVGIVIDRSTSLRIATVSDGFPHFVHLLTEKLFWAVFERIGGIGDVDPVDFREALRAASSAIEPHLRKPYEFAIQKNRSDAEPILWAVADHHEFRRQISDIFLSYQRIMHDLGGQKLTKNQFYPRVNNFSKEKWGKILSNPNRSWYEFNEKMMRGYARLRAENAGVTIGKEHPLE